MRNGKALAFEMVASVAWNPCAARTRTRWGAVLDLSMRRISRS